MTEKKALDRALADRLSVETGRKISRSWARGAVVGGFVDVNGRRESNPSRPVTDADQIDARRARLPEERNPPPTVVVLYEDPWLAAIDKPAGLLTHASADPSRSNAKDIVSEMLGQDVFTQQRLDADASGVLLFAKTAAVSERLTERISARDLEKHYVARVWTPSRRLLKGATHEVSTPLTTRKNGRVVVDPSGKAAKTTFVVRALLDEGRTALLDVQLETGRKHQIRAHLASIGLPIVGDRTYGNEAVAQQLFLHASRLRLSHPVTSEPVDILAAEPPDFEKPLPLVRPLSSPSRFSPRRPPSTSHHRFLRRR